MEARAVSFAAPDGPRLEGRLAIPPWPGGAAALCAPYPPMGGSMSNPMIPALQRALFASGWAALRFNYRGVGRSEGSFEDGVGEIQDARAALVFALAESGAARGALVGWSFGAMVALAASAIEPTPDDVIGIAPPLSIGERVSLPAVPGAIACRVLLVTGSADPYARPGDVESLGNRIGARTEIVDGAGHFFEGRLDEIAGIVTAFLAESG